MVAAFALEIEHGVDHVLDHARAGDLALLGDMADQDDGRAGRFGIADQRLGGGANLGDGARRRIGRVGPQRLDRIENDQVGPPAVGNRRQYVLDIGFRRQFNRRTGDAEPLRAKPDLRYRLFAGNINDAVALLRQCRRGLREQCGLADARIAANQQRRAAHEAAAGGAIKLAYARYDARRVLDLARKRGEHHRPAFARRTQ